MNTEPKGKAWYGKIYSKLETILVEVDSLASQGKVSLKSSDPPGLDSIRDEPEKLNDDHCSDIFDIKQHNGLALLRCKSSFPSAGPTLVDEKLEERSDCNPKAATSFCRNDPVSSQSTHPSPESVMTAIACNDDTSVTPPGISTGDSNLFPFATEIQAAHVQDKVASFRSFSSNSMKVNEDEIFTEDFDDAPLDTIDLYDMTFREDPSNFDDNLLYAARDKTRQLRSFKRKIMDALTSKRRREKEYEQLAIWFGDADMGCDLINTKEHATQSLDSKCSHTNMPFASEDSEWELL